MAVPAPLSESPTVEPLRRNLNTTALHVTLPDTDSREAPTARVGADQMDTSATSQNWRVKDKPEGRYSAWHGRLKLPPMKPHARRPLRRGTRVRPECRRRGIG